jgi:threonine dehydrogenase-like Zn-dependent dehydrogenase
MELGITLVGCGQAPVQRCKSEDYLEIRVESTLTHITDWEELREKIEKGEVDPTIMVTHRFKIDDIAKAYYMQEKRADGLVKCFVETRFSAPRAAGPELTKP